MTISGEGLDADRNADSAASFQSANRQDIEAVAKAIYDCNPIWDQETDIDGRPSGNAYTVDFEQLAEYDQDIFDSLILQAQEAIKVLRGRDPMRIVAVPEGAEQTWRMLPTWMMEDMQKHFKLSLIMGGCFHDAWSSALSVAPLPVSPREAAEDEDTASASEPNQSKA